MSEKAQTLVTEILKLGAQKKNAYVRKDELETELMAGGTPIALFRAVFPSKDSKAKREEHDETVREIELLRSQMDELRTALIREDLTLLSEVDHLWNYENTTSLSQQREAQRKRDRHR